MFVRCRTRFVPGVLVIFTVLGACSEGSVTPDPDPTDPEPVTQQEITRTFSATTFTTTTDGSSTDQLAEGATLDITLYEDGTTTGRLFIPGGGEDGSDFARDLSGTFSFDETAQTVTFDHAADTFVRDMTFATGRLNGVVRLEGEETFSGTTVRLVLESE